MKQLAVIVAMLLAMSAVPVPRANTGVLFAAEVAPARVHGAKPPPKGLLPQSIDFPAPADRPFAVAPFPLLATASSGLPVAYASLSPAVCSVNGSALTVLAIGICSLRASQPGNTQYRAAPSIDRRFTIREPDAGMPEIGGEQAWVDDALPAGAVVDAGDEGWKWVTTPAPYSGALAHRSEAANGLHQHAFHHAAHGLQIVGGDTLFAYVHLDPKRPPEEVMLQWFDGTWEHRAYWGRDAIDAGVAGTAGRRYVGPLPPAGEWTRLEVAAAAVGLEGAVVSGMAFALYGGRATWDRAGRTRGRQKEGQTLRFDPVADRRYDEGPIVLAAQATSGLPVRFTSLTPEVCAVDASLLFFAAAGLCTVRADQSGDDRYLAAPPIERSFGIVPARQTISLPLPAMAALAASPLTVVAAASSGLPVTLVVATPGICALAGNTLTLLAVGVCTIEAAQDGDARYAAAAVVRHSLTVVSTLVNQSIAIDGLIGQFAGALPIRLWGRASSGLPVEFATATPAVCLAGDEFLLALAPGTCTLHAGQGGDAQYRAAVPVEATLGITTVAAGPPFDVPINHVAGREPSALIATDVNGDGKLDLAVLSFNDGAVAILLGQGDGDFAPPLRVLTGIGPMAITAADFNGDGHQDLAVSHVIGQDIAVLLGRGDGTFSPAPRVRVGKALFGLTAVDVDRDGHVDLVVANGTSNGVVGRSVFVLRGNGDGTFASPVEVAADVDPKVLLAADLDRDGAPDIVVVHQAGDSVGVLRNDGTGNFLPMLRQAMGHVPQAATLADLDGDGLPDLAVTHTGTAAIALLRNQGDGSFAPPRMIPVAMAPGSIAAADFDGDGRVDLAVAHPFLDRVVLLHAGNGDYATATNHGVLAQPVSLVVADFNRDGKPDLAAAAAWGNGVSVLLHNADPGTPARMLRISGHGASTPASTAFTVPLAVTLRDAVGHPVAGVAVTFTAPASGASAAFGDRRAAVAVTSNTGIATAPVLVANATAGRYGVTAAAGALETTFTLTNTVPVTGVAPAWQTVALPAGRFGESYQFQLVATGTPAPTYSVQGDVLPPGIALDPATGRLAGTAYRAGTYAGVLVAANGQAPDATLPFTLVIERITQTISFAPIPDRPYSPAPFAPAVSATSKLIVTLESLTPSTCAVQGFAVKLLATGICTLRAMQPGDATWYPAAAVARSFTVLPAVPSVLLEPTAPAGVIGGDETSLSGRVIAPVNSGVAVNGREGLIDEAGRFYVDNVPVDATTTALDVVLTLADGTTLTRSVTVAATGAPAPLSLTASPARAVVPATVEFRLRHRSASPARSIEFDFLGNGVWEDWSRALLDGGDRATVVYHQAGTYHPVVRVTEEDGTVRQQSVTVVVDHVLDRDLLFRSIWSGLTSALVEGRTAHALRYLTSEAATRYESAFGDLATRFPGIVATFATPILVDMDHGVATYAVARTEATETVIYLVDFLRESDGVWRIDSM